MCVFLLLLALVDATAGQRCVAADSEGPTAATNSVGMTLIPIASGTFKMGSPKSEPARSHAREEQVEVTISQPFLMSDTEVTQEQWTKVMGNSPWEGAVSNSFAKKGKRYPAVSVSWEEAMAFCKALTDSERAAGRIASDVAYSLPTEAQWEYACRAGTTDAYSYGHDPSQLSDVAWWGGVSGSGNAASERYAHEVGTRKPNAWNLFDMHGNVSEWCLDGYKDKLPGGKDPLAPASGFSRVVRGGNWESESSGCRSAYRDEASLARRGYSMGFRVIRNVGAADGASASGK